jgi:signal peptidase II
MVTDLGRPAEEQPTTPGPAPAGRGRRLGIVGLAAAVVAADQASKAWALRHAREPVHVIWTLRFFVQFNPGTAFGLGQGSTGLIVGGVIVLVVLLLGLGRRASRTASWPAAVAMGLLLGGAVGNLTDRVIGHHHGAVTDFIDLRWWPIFNVADAAISVGAILLALVLFRVRPGTGGRAGAPSSARRPSRPSLAPSPGPDPE